MQTFVPPQPDPARIALVGARANLAFAQFTAAFFKNPGFGSDVDRRRTRAAVDRAELQVAKLERRIASLNTP